MSSLSSLPFGYWLAFVTAVALVAEAAVQWRRPWAIPTAMVYVTIFGWYVLEPIYTPESMSVFSTSSINATFVSVFIFLMTFRLASPIGVGVFAPAARVDVQRDDLPAERVLAIGAVLWLLLAAFGAYRMGGDVIGALLPLNARAGGNMWSRAAGADAGTFGFAISTCAYLYSLVLALFGMVLPLLKTRRAQIFCLMLILLSWPYAFLQGSRNVAIAVFVPFVFSFLLFSRVRAGYKATFLLGSAVFIEWAMRQIINFRNVGFESGQSVEDEGHLGLNMASELTYCIDFLKSGVLRQQWGWNLLSEAANVVPRFLWPDKPLIGVDYAVARGYGGGENDIGLIATISTGVIGQGVLDFGAYAGPAFMAAIMATWTGILARLWAQGTVPRTCLFLVGIGLTFNLGRNVTLLVLWPMVFAYVLVLAVEKYGTPKASKSRASVSSLLLSADA